MQLLSAGGLLAYGLTITFAAFDWLMSLEPHWFSTMYGVLIMGGQALSAMAFAIVVLSWLSRREPLERADFAESLSRSRQPDARVHDAVDLLRVLAVPDHLGGEHPRRDRVVHPSHRPRLAVSSRSRSSSFISPCRSSCCCRARSSGTRAMLSKVAAGLLVMRFFDLFWLSAPAFAHDGALHFHWLDVALPVSLAADLARLLRVSAARPRAAAAL